MMCLVANRLTSDDLRDLRKKLRFTQAEMAQRLGVEREIYKNWEYRDPPPKVFEMIETMRNNPDSPLMREGRLVSLAGTPLVPVRVVGRAAAGEGFSNVDVDAEMGYVPDRLARLGTLGWLTGFL